MPTTDRQPEQSDPESTRTRVLSLIPCGIALNLALGTVVHTIKVPLYLDAVGTIVVTLIAGLRAGIVVGVGSFLIGGILTNPVLPWFAGTQACIAAYTHILAKAGWLSFQTRRDEPSSTWKWIRINLRPILAGLGLGVVAGTVSAPVIVALFGGITGSGASLVVAFLLKSGKTLLSAVLLSGLASEPLDKLIQMLLALSIVSSLPSSLRAAFGGGTRRQLPPDRSPRP